MPMEQTLYIVILGYFILGAIAFYLIARRKSIAEQKNTWAKYFTYLLIIHALYGSIYFGPPYFSLLAAFVVFMGYLEIIKLYQKDRHQRSTRFILLSLTGYTVVATPFLVFSFSEKPYLYFVFVVVAIFDAFSQISGQLWGRKKLVPSISPGKTVGGLVGGGVLAIATGGLLSGLMGISLTESLLFSTIITIFSLCGDLLASWYKRQYRVKDFGRILPGHGGFLDRFDSLIPGGAAMYLLNLIL